MRILHFSDIHVGIGLREVHVSRWFGKRALGGVNLLLGRQRHFLDARRKLAALAQFREEHQVDLVICSGDYTALGLEREFRNARRAVEPLLRAPLGYVSVPGNHDLYVPNVVRERRFERHFGDTLASDLPQYVADGPWPQVRLPGEGIAVVAVNSARPNPPWLSSGRIPDVQLEALRRALRDPAVRDRFIIVVSHYAPCLADGRPDSRRHGLDNVDDYLGACNEAAHGAVLCGHVHRRFHVRLAQCRLPVFCAGSTTMNGREGLWLFELDEADRGRPRATPGHWDGNAFRLEEGDRSVFP